MAKKGVRYVCFGKLDEQTGKYSDGKFIGPTTQLNGSINKATADDYGDDMVQEHADVVVGGALTWEANNDSEEIYTYLLGHKVDETSGELIVNANDVAPYVGVACITQAEGKWIGKFYPKVQFAEPSDDNSTITDSITFGHVTIEGAIFLNSDYDLKRRKRFDTLAEAKTWVQSKIGMTATNP